MRLHHNVVYVHVYKEGSGSRHNYVEIYVGILLVIHTGIIHTGIMRMISPPVGLCM